MESNFVFPKRKKAYVSSAILVNNFQMLMESLRIPDLYVAVDSATILIVPF